MASLLWFEIRSRLGAILGWSVGLSLIGSMYTLIYPQMADQIANLADLPIYRILGVSLLSFEGYLSSTVIMFLAVILGSYALTTGVATLAGEEEEGTLELLVTTRLPRWQIVTAKAVALLVVLFLILIIAGCGIALAYQSIAADVESDLTPLSVVIAYVSALPLLLAVAMIALFLGAWLPARRYALMAATAIFIMSYFGENIGAMVDAMEWLRPLSLFSYYDTSATLFSEGSAPRDVAVLLGVALLFFGLALLAFERRNITVGSWAWTARQRK